MLALMKNLTTIGVGPRTLFPSLTITFAMKTYLKRPSLKGATIRMVDPMHLVMPLADPMAMTEKTRDFHLSVVSGVWLLLKAVFLNLSLIANTSLGPWDFLLMCLLLIILISTARFQEALSGGRRYVT